MTGLSKGLAGAAGAASGTGALAFGIYKLSPSKELKTISSLLDSKKRKLIKSQNGSEEAWKTAWQEYRKNFNNSNTNPFSLTLAKGTSSVASENATQEFMEACEAQGTKKVKDTESKDYQLFLKYCTRDTLMSDLVLENSKRKALVKKDSESEDANWKAAWAEYKKENTNTANQMDHWKLTDWSTKNSGDKAPVSFMDRCDKELKRAYHDTEGDDYKKVISWCTESS
ncbi:hypothetical protein HF1_11190 [Mycoplasma haemofelis str. Langford 1]|uniref:Uncharacterized protein n=1 Tax=Mycoplasma haemofelis (strain Langford 1) TaxID=941640 RepID=E8ZJ06_MYCHL|nr:hypothetical protein [Mycoplasma haemofelis]CBY93127.1 hypothetical protein HF1_11190 [Mycoplasma haemofelis str. Langford 1]